MEFSYWELVSRTHPPTLNTHVNHVQTTLLDEHANGSVQIPCIATNPLLRQNSEDQGCRRRLSRGVEINS